MSCPWWGLANIDELQNAKHFKNGEKCIYVFWEIRCSAQLLFHVIVAQNRAHSAPIPYERPNVNFGVWGVCLCHATRLVSVYHETYLTYITWLDLHVTRLHVAPEWAATRLMVASGGVLCEGYGHGGPGVCLGDALLRRMLPYLPWYHFVNKI